jgi:hypothetical protein
MNGAACTLLDASACLVWTQASISSAVESATDLTQRLQASGKYVGSTKAPVFDVHHIQQSCMRYLLERSSSSKFKQQDNCYAVNVLLVTLTETEHKQPVIALTSMRC